MILQHSDEQIAIRRAAAENVTMLRVDHLTYRVWMVLMLSADHRGVWRGSLGSLAILCNASTADVRASVKILEDSTMDGGPYLAAMHERDDGPMVGLRLLCDAEDGRAVRTQAQMRSMRRARESRARRKAAGSNGR